MMPRNPRLDELLKLPLAVALAVPEEPVDAVPPLLSVSVTVYSPVVMLEMSKVFVMNRYK